MADDATLQRIGRITNPATHAVDHGCSNAVRMAMIQTGKSCGFQAGAGVIQDDGAHTRLQGAGGGKQAAMAATDDNGPRSFRRQAGDRVRQDNAIGSLGHLRAISGTIGLPVGLTGFAKHPYREPNRRKCQCGAGGS